MQLKRCRFHLLLLQSGKVLLGPVHTGKNNLFPSFSVDSKDGLIAKMHLAVESL